MKTLISTLLVALCITTQAQITSTFDTDADGWTFYNAAFTSIAVTHNPTNGNPGGYISATYASNSGTTNNNTNNNNQVWFAPTKFLGNHLVKSLGMNLKFDLQQSQGGTVSGVDVVVQNGGNYMYFNLPVKPSVAPAWSSYSLPLDETVSWFWNSTVTLATRSQIMAILTNVTSIEIRGTYATNAAYTSGLDNVILEQRILTPPPVATSLSATSGKPGNVITITGSGFNTTASNNVVSFGVYAGTKAVVQLATATQLQVVVPQGAVYGPITITNIVSGLSAKTLTPFNPVFDGGGRIITASFKNRFSIPTIPNQGWFVGDIDGDGWEDFAIANNSTVNAVDIYRNLGLGGTLSAASFTTKVSVAIPKLGGGLNGAGLWFADLDGDGKLDAVSSNTSGAGAAFVTLRNTSTPGSISFEAPEYWAGGSDETPIALVADLDGDGRPDLLSGEGSLSSSAFSYFWINQNLSTPGNIEFAGPIFPFNGTVVNAFAVATAGDLDGDGKNELVITHNFGQMTTVLKNTSTPGVLSFTNAFTISTNQYNTSIHVVDMNLDGKNDLVYKISGEASFHIRLNSNSGGALVAADFVSDVIISGDLGTNGGISIVDFNGDGKHDVAATDNTDVGVYENIYSGGVFDATAFVPAHQVLGGGSSSPRVSDLNHDGKPDFLIASGGAISIVENQNIHAPVISLNTVSPLKGAVGSTVTITGNNFSTILTDNEVWFGAVSATVLTATPTQLTVSVPAGATYAPVRVRKGELTSSYHLPFATSFSPGVTFNNTHFAPPITYTLTGAAYDIEVGDLDLDGNPDVVAVGSGLISHIFRNTHTSGSISATSLTTAGTISSSSSYPKLVDCDGDGLADIVSPNGRAYQNTSTPGMISFAAETSLALGAASIDLADLNLDGKTDIITNTVPGNGAQLILKENRSRSGIFDPDNTYGTFSGNFIIGKPSDGGAVLSVDLDNDEFPDIITTNPATDNISIFKNAGKFRVSTASIQSHVVIAVGDSPNRIYSGDFNTDGKVDLLVYHGGTSSTLLTVFQNTSTVGSISFTRIDLTNPSATSVATIADLDGDGKPEIITTSESGNRFSIFKNLHTSGALTAASFAAPFNTTVTAPRGITTGDLNLDGKPEIILTRAAGLLVVYENLVSVTQNFITQWNLATAGSGPTQLTFGTATSGTVNYAWQELSPGTASGGGSWSGATLTITGLPTGATIRLQIAPANFQRVINSGTDRNRLIQVEQWGSIAWASMQGAFSNCTNLQVTATDVPNLSSVTDMSGMFAGCTVLNSPSNINTWNTTNVSNMAQTFNGARAFNQDIGAWNTTAVINMQGMFFQATAFNQNISAWNTAAVTNMQSMFFQATTFNQNIGAWNTSAVTIMRGMFENAIAFNQNIGSWNTAAVTTMKDMFQGAVVFDQNIGSWNTGAATNMEFMFNGASAFNQNIGFWNTGAVTDMERMFLNASAFNQNISSWNTSTVIDMRSMFDNATVFNQNIGAWTLNPAVTMTNMFDTSGIDCNNYSSTLIGWSANPSTPNGRSLGANGRQYGTNAVAARTNLVSTKAWTITGDTPSGAVCGSASVPTITNFNPTSGPVGTTVTITGTNFSTTTASNTVSFNGTTAVVTASTTTSITTAVPTGATTGKISVTVAGNTATSANDFIITTSGEAVTINVEPLSTSPGGTVTKNLLPLITTLGNNLDINSITVTVQPPSGAVASVSNGSLTVDYTNISFSGRENITIRACDTDGNCATKQFEIEISGDVKVYNAVSPDGKNPILHLQFIDTLSPKNQVSIYNRWGDEVFSISDYDNKTRVFAGLTNGGSKLPAGTYFYKVVLTSANKTLTGFLALKY